MLLIFFCLWCLQVISSSLFFLSLFSGFPSFLSLESMTGVRPFRPENALCHCNQKETILNALPLGQFKLMVINDYYYYKWDKSDDASFLLRLPFSFWEFLEISWIDASVLLNPKLGRRKHVRTRVFYCVRNGSCWFIGERSRQRRPRQEVKVAGWWCCCCCWLRCRHRFLCQSQSKVFLSIAQPIALPCLPALNWIE